MNDLEKQVLDEQVKRDPTYQASMSILGQQAVKHVQADSEKAEALSPLGQARLLVKQLLGK